MPKIHKTQQTIIRISNMDISIENKICLMLDYISSVSRYSFNNRYYAQKYFMEWLLKQNVRDLHIAEKL